MYTKILLKAFVLFVFAVLMQAPVFAQQKRVKKAESARPGTEKPAPKEAAGKKDKDVSEAAKKKPSAPKEAAGKKDKDKEQRGNAYGKNKGDLKGREFGQQRAEDARSKNDDKLKKEAGAKKGEGDRVGKEAKKGEGNGVGKEAGAKKGEGDRVGKEANQGEKKEVKKEAKKGGNK